MVRKNKSTPVPLAWRREMIRRVLDFRWGERKSVAMLTRFVNSPHFLPRVFGTIGLILVLGVSMNAEAGLFGGVSWKEEVLLHDGQKIIVKRSQSYGGRHEIGQASPIKEHTVSFTLPSSSKSISWTSEFSKDVGRANFDLLALHVLNDTPYIVASPAGCLAYNKWGRPNPPYIFFKYDGKEWQRIPLAEFPTEFKTVNIDFGMPWDMRDRKVKFDKGDLLTADTIKRRNEKNRNPAHKTILREAYAGSVVECEELIKYKGYWIMPNDPVARGMVDSKTK